VTCSGAALCATAIVLAVNIRATTASDARRLVRDLDGTAFVVIGFS
jgi:hypothetical protein